MGSGLLRRGWAGGVDCGAELRETTERLLCRLVVRLFLRITEQDSCAVAPVARRERVARFFATIRATIAVAPSGLPGGGGFGQCRR